VGFDQGFVGTPFAAKAVFALVALMYDEPLPPGTFTNVARKW
jgi:hypothetical protein